MSKNKAVTVVKKNKEIEQTPSAPFAMSPEVLMAQAIQAGASVETMQSLLAMRRELKAEWAKEQYDHDMAMFQMNCPIIKKTKEVKDNDGKVAYKYAPIDSIVAQVKSSLEKYGFSYKIETTTHEKGVTAKCIAKHKFGHSEDSEVNIPLGTKTRMMNDTQVTASAMTFAKRYAFCNVFGIMTGDSDIDGKIPTNSEPIKTPIEEVEKRLMTGIKTCDMPKLIQSEKFVKNHKELSDDFKKKFAAAASKRAKEIEG